MDGSYYNGLPPSLFRVLLLLADQWWTERDKQPKVITDRYNKVLLAKKNCAKLVVGIIGH